MTIATKAIGAYCRESGHALGNLDAHEIRGLAVAASAVRKAALEEAIEAIRQEKEIFSTAAYYSTGQRGHTGRFACDQCIKALTRLMGDE
jgi:hypothetical protein